MTFSVNKNEIELLQEKNEVEYCCQCRQAFSGSCDVFVKETETRCQFI